VRPSTRRSSAFACGLWRSRGVVCGRVRSCAVACGLPRSRMSLRRGVGCPSGGIFTYLFRGLVDYCAVRCGRVRFSAVPCGRVRSSVVVCGPVRSCAVPCGRARSRAVENRYFVTKLQWLHHKVCLTASHHPPRPPENNTYSIDRRNQSARRNLAQLTSE
jgi:hypothetical protein